jgi:hypothetical protein
MLGRAVGAAVAASIACAMAAPGTAGATYTAPWWRLDATVASSPALLPEAQVIATAANDGDGDVDGAESPIVFSDVLPATLTPVAVKARVSGDGSLGAGTEIPPADCALDGQTVTCRYPGTVLPYERLVMRITVQVNEPGAGEDVVTAAGANAGSKSLSKTLSAGPEPQLGLEGERYELMPEGEDGGSDIQAGSHPFQLTIPLDFNQTLRRYRFASKEEALPSAASALPRDVHIKLPPGLVGDAGAVPQCPEAAFAAIKKGNVNICPDDTAVGVASVTVNLDGVTPFVAWAQLMVPVFNLEPAAGEPARFGFEAEGATVIIKTAVPTGGDYAVEGRVEQLTQLAQIISSQVTLWGVPDDPRHDSARGWDCLGGGEWARATLGEGSTLEKASCPELETQAPKALLTLPTSCSVQEPATLEDTLIGESWPFAEGESKHTTSFSAQLGEESPTTMSGCPLPFAPSLSLEPEQHAASTPTGVNVDVEMPQEDLTAASGLAEPALLETTVALPEGMQLNPSSANGLEACPEGSEGGYEGIGFTGFRRFSTAEAGSGAATFTSGFSFGAPDEPPPSCPNASKIGTVKISTPLLPKEVEGAVYLATPAPNGEPGRNPFNSLVALYIVAQDKEAGVLVKLAGKGELNEQTGQLTTTFANTPQLPFANLKLHITGGPRAALSTPVRCGPYPTTSTFVPWSGGAPAHPQSTFEIPCASNPSDALAFSPAFKAGVENSQAGAFTTFSLDLERPDGDQQLTGIAVQMPQGISGLLSKLTPCPEPPAGQEWSCGEASLIGHTVATAGVGDEPVTLPGKAYLTTGYDGAPFGVLVQTPAVAGPFNLGMVNVRSRINVNPLNALITITSDPGPRGEAIPTRVKGIPADLEQVQVDVDRPGFIFNPTDCAAMKVEGSLQGAEGASVPVSYPFGVANCAGLPFKPGFSASVKGQASKAGGVTFTAKLVSPGLGVANIAKASLQLPKQLPSRLTTIQKACLARVFEANPASCPEGSDVGTATVHTPVLRSPLSGPAYLVSHGNAAFPDLEFVLQGEGITLIIDGKTDIKKGITYAKFESVPDQPFTTFEAVFPAGPHSALTANVAERKHYDLCGEKLTMPTTLTGQNGAAVEQQTQISIHGCPAVKKPSKLVKALAACRTKHRHAKPARVSCERVARRRYGAKKRAAKVRR